MKKKRVLVIFLGVLVLSGAGSPVQGGISECVECLGVLADEWLGSGSGSQANVYDDSVIDFKDYAVLAGQWPDDCQLVAPVFKPMERNYYNTEEHTGLYTCPLFKNTGDLYPMNTRLYATRESVTDSVAMRIDFLAGAEGGFSMEVHDDEWDDVFAVGSAGLTMYAKASSNFTLNINNTHQFGIGTEWEKIDIPWSAFGGSPADPSIGGWQFEMWLDSVPVEDGWYILDRMGTETPYFSINPTIAVAAGPDDVINTADIVGGADVLLPTVGRLGEQLGFTIYAFGDSITAGAQASRGNWWMDSATVVQYLYFSHLARLLEARYGYSGIAYVQEGYGGWTSEAAKSIVASVLSGAQAEDVVIIQFGGNDMAWMTSTADIDEWLDNTAYLIAEAKTHTSQIIITSPTMSGQPMLDYADEISSRMRTFAAAQEVAYVDVTEWMSYRGRDYCFAPLANFYHPDAMGHIMIAEIMETLFGAPAFDWPEYE